MYNKTKKSSQRFYLPKINPSFSSNKKDKLSSIRSNNSLSNYQQQLKSLTPIKPKKRIHRLKTVNVNDNQVFDDLRREMKSIKNAIDYKFNQYNHKIENKLMEYSLFLGKKQSPQIIYQPYPMVLPFMNPPNSNSYNTIPDYEDDSSYFRNKLKSRKIPSKSSKKNKMLTRKFRINVYAVLFMIRLKKYCDKVIKYRKNVFDKFIQNEFKQQLTAFKKFMIEGCKQFLVLILQKQDYQLKLNDRDSENFKKQKIAMTHKCLQNLINCLQRIVQSSQFDKYNRLIYLFCKHGSYACLQNLLTTEQLENLSISEKNNYLQAEKNLEKAQIINFVFMKLLIYNGFGRAERIDADQFSNEKQILHENIRLLASLLYENLMMIQDDYIVSSPECYVLGNYTQVRAKIYPTESLTVKSGEYRKNEVISGLLHENYLKSVYLLQKQWIKERNSLIQIIQKIYKKIANYHRQITKQFL